MSSLAEIVIVVGPVMLARTRRRRSPATSDRRPRRGTARLSAPPSQPAQRSAPRRSRRARRSAPACSRHRRPVGHDLGHGSEHDAGEVGGRLLVDGEVEPAEGLSSSGSRRRRARASPRCLERDHRHRTARLAARVEADPGDGGDGRDPVGKLARRSSSVRKAPFERPVTKTRRRSVHSAASTSSITAATNSRSGGPSAARRSSSTGPRRCPAGSRARTPLRSARAARSLISTWMSAPSTKPCRSTTRAGGSAVIAGT